ncbi:hypothetical protein SAMN05216561_11370 [Nocardioides psychrotolerans]|uniref:HNH nuclease domain-containing protein n=1 Tax=Nocardioides psychrotolerans TaxID=1005945 RepID=A0A1I3LA37_9ACTN|nr:hypothetical protein SAMN05216561_11370 [Nocardioides psychrotolerans]
MLHVHLAEAALVGGGSTDGCLVRVENTRSRIWADRVRDWCASPDAHVVVRPVIDLADHVHVGGYEIPDRLRVQRELLDHHCVFPWCTRTARSCGIDHITPRDQSGTTCSCNTAPLCRGHHRAKTHSGWDDDAIDDGVLCGDHRTGCSSAAMTTAAPRSTSLRPPHPARPESSAPQPAAGGGHRHVRPQPRPDDGATGEVLTHPLRENLPGPRHHRPQDTASPAATASPRRRRRQQPVRSRPPRPRRHRLRHRDQP